MHELTKLLVVGQDRLTWEKRDKIIRTWLEEKAKYLAYRFPKDNSHEGKEKYYRGQLGLEREPYCRACESPGETGQHNHPVEPTPEELRKSLSKTHLLDDKEVFGEDNTVKIKLTPGVMVGEGSMNFHDMDIRWDICPVKGCHAPRPVSKSLAQQLFEAFQEGYGGSAKWKNADIRVKAGSQAQADCARKYFEAKY